MKCGKNDYLVLTTEIDKKFLFLCIKFEIARKIQYIRFNNNPSFHIGKKE